MPMMWMSIFLLVVLIFFLIISFVHFFFISLPHSVSFESDIKKSWLK